jgi:hypothetical protein
MGRLAPSFQRADGKHSFASPTPEVLLSPSTSSSAGLSWQGWAAPFGLWHTKNIKKRWNITIFRG